MFTEGCGGVTECNLRILARSVGTRRQGQMGRPSGDPPEVAEGELEMVDLPVPDDHRHGQDRCHRALAPRRGAVMSRRPGLRGLINRQAWLMREGNVIWGPAPVVGVASLRPISSPSGPQQ